MSELELKVFYTWGEGVIAGKFDPGFQRKVNWDLPLLAGYQYEFVHNTAANPGSHHFLGIKNPTLISQLERFAPDMMLVYGWSFWSHLNIMRHFKGKLPVLFRGDSTLIDDIAGFSLKKNPSLYHSEMGISPG